MRTIAVVLSLAALGAFPLAAPAVDAGATLALPAIVPGVELPLVKEHRYVMSGAARPLLFWIGRDNVGIARIAWRENSDGVRGYELLVGTDPDRAPRGLNRWGFISEEQRPGGGGVLALMTGSQETSYAEEAEAASHGQGDGDFRVIRSRTDGATVAWRLARIRTPEALTVRQVGDAIDYVRQYNDQADGRQRAIDAGVRPGFLVAVADLVDATVREGGVAARRPAPVRYAFGERTYELTVRDLDAAEIACGGRRVPAVRVGFETRTLATGDRTRFELTAGLDGELTGVPVAIQWQPRWWLRVGLRLESCRL
jgi:hypothetical protein